MANKLDKNKWNNDTLKSMGINQKAVPPSVVKSVGDLQKATLWDGTIVERSEYLFVDGHGLVKCCPYELHFLYCAPKEHKGYGLMCTCGSIGGVVGLSAYSKLASPTSTGKLIVCIRHTATKNNVGLGTHADGSTE